MEAFFVIGKISNEDFKKVLDEYLSGVPLKQLKTKYGLVMRRQDFKTWLEKYKIHGKNCFNNKSNKRYPSNFKKQVVEEYFNTSASLRELIIKYNISCTTVVRRWVERYTSGEELKDYSPKPEVYQMKKQSISIQTKIEVIQYYLSDTSITYGDVAQHFEIPYSQVYRWIQVFKQKGYQGLDDKRGHKVYTEHGDKTVTEKLEEENYWLKLENEVLKKQMSVRKEVSKDQKKK